MVRQGAGRRAAGDWFLLAAALPVVTGTRLLLWLAPRSWWTWVLRAGLAGRGEASARFTPRRIGRAVSSAARLVPDATCLTQAIAARGLLWAAGHPATLTIGVRKGSDGRLEAHAWVQSGAEAVVGVPPAGTFQTMSPPAAADGIDALVAALRVAPGQPIALSAAAWELARKHRVHGILRAGRPAPPAEMGEERAQTLRALAMTVDLLDLIGLLERAGIPVLSLKGPPLSVLLYGSASARRSADLDILVSPADAARAGQVLLASGYADRSAADPEEVRIANQRWGCEHHFLSPSGRLIELHWRLSSRTTAFDPDFAGLWAQRELIPAAGKAIPAPGREDLLLYLCVHGSKHLWHSLIWVADLATLIRITPSLDWAAVLARSRRWGGRRRLLIGLALAERVLGAGLPDEVKQAMALDAGALCLSRTMERHLRSGPMDDVYDLAYHLLQLRMLDRQRDRLRYLAFLLEKAVIPNHHDRNWIALPAAASPLYYLIRPLRKSLEAAGNRLRPVRFR